MRRRVKAAIAVIVGLFIGIVLFFPWQILGETIFSIGARLAAQNGIFVTASSSETSGLFSKHFTYGGVKADFPIFRFTAREVRITPSIISSVFTSTKSGTVSVSRGSVIPVTRQALEWDEGTADFALTPSLLTLQNISFTGPAVITGFLEISRETAKITRARLLLKVPAELDRMLNMISMTGMLPLSKVKPGEWRIER